MVYGIPAWNKNGFLRSLTKDWRLSAIYQAQSGFPLTISVVGDTANAGTLLGENPVRANYTRQPVFDGNSRTSDRWFNTAAFATSAHSHSATPAVTLFMDQAGTLSISLCDENLR